MGKQRILDIDAEQIYIQRCFGITRAHTNGEVTCMHPLRPVPDGSLYLSDLHTKPDEVTPVMECFLNKLPELQHANREHICQLLLYRCKLETQKRRRKLIVATTNYETVYRRLSINSQLLRSRIYDILERILHPLLYRFGLERHNYPLFSADMLEVRLLEYGNALRRAVQAEFIAEETRAILDYIIDKK